MTYKNLSISILYILFLLFSKEFFSYDSEKFVIICIISFIVLSYYLFKDSLYHIFISKSSKLKQEYIELILLKQQIEQDTQKFWSVFLNLQQRIININCWIKNNIINFIKKYNFNRDYILYFLIKDQLNIIIKNTFKIYQYLNLFLIKYIRTIFFINIIEHKNNSLTDLNFYFNRLIGMLDRTIIISIILNKLNIDKEFIIHQTFITYYTNLLNGKR